MIVSMADKIPPPHDPGPLPWVEPCRPSSPYPLFSNGEGGSKKGRSNLRVKYFGKNFGKKSGKSENHLEFKKKILARFFKK